MASLEAVRGVQRLELAVPDGQKYSCRMCGGCCRWWRIEVTPAERDRLLAHDWASESPRLEGIKLFEETKARDRWEGRIQTALLDGQCVFLEGDGLCLIHKTLGLDAKPAGCRRFPVRLAVTPGGILMGADYACQAVILNLGEPFEELAGGIREQLAWRGLGMAQTSATEIESALIPGMALPWPAYMEVESALLEILGKAGYLVTTRLAAAGELLSAMAIDWSGRRVVERDDAQKWLSKERGRDYSRPFLAAKASHSPVSLAVSSLAPAIGNLEVPHSPASPMGSAAIGYAMAVAAEEGVLYLSTLDATVDLSAAGRVACDMDDAKFDDYLRRFLGSYVMRKSLLDSPDLKAGWEYLVTCFNLVQWYARASASLAERHQVGLDDLIAGIQVVEKAYVP